MTEYELSQDMLTVLEFIEETGGMHCTGSCARKKPDEVHCHAVGPELNLSSSGVRDRIGRLDLMGLIKCETETVKTGSVRRLFSVTAEGQRVLNSNMSEPTQQTYTRSVRQLVDFYEKTPEKITEQELQDYFHHRKYLDKWNAATLRICHSGIKLFFINVLKWDRHTLELIIAKVEELPPMK